MAEAWSLALLEGGYIGTPFFTDRMLGWISYPVAATPGGGANPGPQASQKAASARLVRPQR
jgi:hypothetical protein